MSLDILKKFVILSLKIFLTYSYAKLVFSKVSQVKQVLFPQSPRYLCNLWKKKTKKQNTIATTKAELILRIFLTFCPIWAWIFL